MKVNVYVKLDHHAYARSHVAEVRVVGLHDTPEGYQSPEEMDPAEWLCVAGIEVEDWLARWEAEGGNRGRAYH